MVMRCIFCTQDRPPSIEHIFPLAIGGKITTDRVCAACNSTLGSRVDSALINFLPIQTRRAELGLVGHGGQPPSLFEMLLGEQTVVGRDANRIRTTLDKATGKLDLRQLYHSTDVTTPDGNEARQITLDARDADQIPKIIQRERKRHGLSPLSEEALAAEVAKASVTTVEKPVVKVDIQVSFAFLRHAMLKIAYELAFRWLGESYLDDPSAVELRQAILKNDLASTDALAGYIGWAEPCTAFQNYWIPHKAHHLAYATAVSGSVIVAVRVFDIYAAAVPVNAHASHYVGADALRLPFLAIDAANGRTIENSFGEEQCRLAAGMTKHHRIPPFSDPLPDIEQGADATISDA